jgi:hypothetical protein
MKPTLKLTALVLIPVILLVLASCKKEAPAPAANQGAEPAANQGSEPAAIAVGTVTTTATVEGIDHSTRMVTLKNADGTTETFKVGKEVVNLDQVQVGDQVKTTYLESLVVYVQKAGGPPMAGAGTTVALAPKGAMPGMVVANTVDLEAKIDEVDADNHMITVTGAAGKQRTMKVAPSVNLADLKKGDDVTVRYTEALAIMVEKPSGPMTPTAAPEANMTAPAAPAEANAATSE